MKTILMTLTLLITLPLGSAFGAEDSHTGSEHTNRNYNLDSLQAGISGGCNPLDSNACKGNSVCWSEIPISTILDNTSKFKCSGQTDCGDTGVCAVVKSDGSAEDKSDSPVCIPRGKCVDTSIHADFEAYIPTQYSFDLDVKQCVAKLKSGESEVVGSDNITMYTAEVMKFTLELEHANAVMNDYFGINKQGKTFAVKFNQERTVAQEAYLEARQQLEQYLEKVVQATQTGEIDMASSIAYYDVMADIYDLEATSSATFLNQFLTIYQDLDAWGNTIATPKDDFYSVGQNNNRSLATFIGTKKVSGKSDDDEKDESGKDSNSTEVGVNNDKSSASTEIPIYQLNVNICGKPGLRNGDCVVMCEHLGLPVVDPVIETEKVKKDPGFLGLKRLGCNIGKAIGMAFGSKKAKEKDCKYDHIEQVADHFVEYGSSPICSYIAKNPVESAAQRKIETVNIVREKVAELASYYDASYKMNTELAQCMKLISGKVSATFDGGFSNNLGSSGNTNNNNEAGGGVNANVDLSGSAVNKAPNFSAGSGALTAFRNKLKESFGSKASDSALEGSGLDPLGSDKGKKALSDASSKFRKERESAKSRSESFVNKAKKGGSNSSEFQAVQSFRQLASKLSVSTDTSKRADPLSFGSFFNSDMAQSSLLGNSGDSNTNRNTSDSLAASSGAQSGAVNDGSAGSKSALAKSAKAATEDARLKKLARSNKDSDVAGAGGQHSDSGIINDKDANGEDEGKKKIAADEEAEEGDELLAEEKKVDMSLPPNFDEYDLASMLDDVQSEKNKYSRRPDDSLWDIITKTYMRSAIKTIYGDRETAAANE